MRAYCGLGFQCQGDLIHASHEVGFASGIDFKCMGLAVRGGNRLCLKIYREDMVRPACLFGQLVDNFQRQDDREDAILVAIIIEDIGIRRGDDACDALIIERPWSVFARRPTTEILPGNQDAGIRVGLLVQDKIRIGRAIGFGLHLMEEADREASARRGLQELLRDDHVSVDICHRFALLKQWCSGSGERGEGFHGRL